MTHAFKQDFLDTFAHRVAWGEKPRDVPASAWDDTKFIANDEVSDELREALDADRLSRVLQQLCRS